MAENPTLMNETIANLTSQLDDEVEDPEEGTPVSSHPFRPSQLIQFTETFVLYAQPIPSQNLGFVDPKARSVQVTLSSSREYTIHQSPAVLSSNRAGGTTGAVLWKITPLFASWLTSTSNILLSTGILNSSSTVIELGCGISPLNAFALSPHVSRYVLTDQPYVQRLVQQNLDENVQLPSAKRGSKKSAAASLAFEVLDWETDTPTSSLTGTAARSFDAVLACDCVFNYALVEPFVQTCADLCRLRSEDETPCVCVVAQQLRSDEVFLLWLTTFTKHFRAWKVPDDALPDGLKSSDGFVVHVGILRGG